MHGLTHLHPTRPPHTASHQGLCQSTQGKRQGRAARNQEGTSSSSKTHHTLPAAAAPWHRCHAVVLIGMIESTCVRARCLPSRRLFLLTVIPLLAGRSPWAHPTLSPPATTTQPSHRIPLLLTHVFPALPFSPSLLHHHPHQNRQPTTATPTSAPGGGEKAAAAGASSSWSITQVPACVVALASACSHQLI